MKPTLRIYVFLSLLVATSMTLSGCATQGKPPPTITLDEAVAAQPLPELPKPIEVVAVPQPLPLPEQLKLLPDELEAKTAPESADEKVRVTRANQEARIDRKSTRLNSSHSQISY